jgi:hypothetical protein
MWCAIGLSASAKGRRTADLPEVSGKDERYGLRRFIKELNGRYTMAEKLKFKEANDGK